MSKVIIAIACLALALCFIFTLSSFAAEKKTVGQNIKAGTEKVIAYPAKLTNEAVKATTKTAEVAGEATKETGVAVSKVATGEGQEIPKVITEPITGAGETVKTAVEETVKAPVEAAKEEAAAK
jgi:hypothetical protein